MNDSMPIVVQLQGKDGLEAHAITIYMNNIYDLSSRYILQKSKEAIEWCCGEYGFECTLKTYILKIETKNNSKKRSRCSNKCV